MYERVDGCCETCGVKPNKDLKQYLEAHERWGYDETTGVQTLKRLVALCTSCHQATHMGLAQVNGNEERALRHLSVVRGCSLPDAQRHSKEAFKVWEMRSRIAWACDLSLLQNNGICIKPRRAPGHEDRFDNDGYDPPDC